MEFLHQCFTHLLRPTSVVLCGIPLLVFLLRLKIRRTPLCNINTSLVGKTILITGATSGIGVEVARECAARGARLVIGYRSKEKLLSLLEHLKNGDIICLYLDLSEPASVMAFVCEVCQSISKLHVLVNNAAYLGSKRMNSCGDDVVLTTNFLSPYILTRGLLNHNDLDTSDLRVINVTSGSYDASLLHFEDMGMTSRLYDIYTAYGESKLALLLFSLSLPEKLPSVSSVEHSNIISIAVHPGAVKTGLLREWPGVRGKLMRLLSLLCFRSPVQGAATVVYAIVTEPARQLSGRLLTDCAILDVDHPNLNDRDIAALWKYAERSYQNARTSYDDGFKNNNRE